VNLPNVRLANFPKPAKKLAWIYTTAFSLKRKAGIHWQVSPLLFRVVVAAAGVIYALSLARHLLASRCGVYVQ
jgi:hypothetical protein